MDKKYITGSGESGEPHEIKEDEEKTACLKLRAECSILSKRLHAYIGSDPEYQGYLQLLQGAIAEYEAGGYKKKHEKRKRKQIEKIRQDLNVYCFYNDINFLLLQSPNTYACLICQNRHPEIQEDGTEICMYYEGVDDEDILPD